MQHDLWVTDVAFSPNGLGVISGEFCIGISASGKDMCPPITAHLWDPSTGEEYRRIEQYDTFSDLAFSSDGTLVATAEGCLKIIPCQSKVHIWNQFTGEEVLTKIFDQPVTGVAFIANDKEVIVWLDRTLQILQVPIEGIPFDSYELLDELTFSPDKTWMATRELCARNWTCYTSIRVWRTDTWDEIAKINFETGISDISFTPNKNYLISVMQDGHVEVWDFINDEVVFSFSVVENIGSIADISSDGNWMAYANDDGAVSVWNINTGLEAALLKSNLFVRNVKFSPDGNLLATSDGDISLDDTDSLVKIWDTTKWQEVGQLHHKKEVLTLAFSPDSTLLASGGEGTVLIFDIGKNKVVAELKQRNTSALVFNVDGSLIATGEYCPDFTSCQASIYIWDVLTGKRIFVLSNNEKINTILGLNFSLDGNYLVSSEGCIEIPCQTNITVWDMESGQELSRVKREESRNVVSFSPDGSWIIDGGYKNPNMIWKWRTEELISDVCTRLTRNFTKNEWQTFLNDEEYRLTCPNLPVPSD